MKFFKEMKQFHVQCLKGLMVLLLIGGCFCSYIYFKLEDYEKGTKEGALDYWITLLEMRDYDRLYEISNLVQNQFNPKDQYIAYMKETYEWRELNNISFKEMYYSDNVYTYYDMMSGKDKIGTLMVKEVNNGVTNYSALVRVENRNIYIESNLTTPIYVNGIEVNEDYRLSEGKNYSCFDGLNDPTLAPQAMRYHLDNLIDEPVVSVKDENGIVVKDALTDVYYVGNKMNADQLKEAEEVFKKFSMTYSKWTSEDESFYSVRQLIYPKTALADALATFNNRFFSLHNQVDFENWKFEDMAFLSDEGMIGTVSFDYVVYVEDAPRTYKNTYQLTFMKKDKQWLLTSMSINNEEQRDS